MNDGNSFRFDLWLYNEMMKRGWNVQDMAQKSKLSRQTIVYLLAGERNPTLYTVGRVVAALGMHIEIVQN